MLRYVIGENTVYDYIVAICIFIITYVVTLIFRKTVIKKAQSISEKKEIKRDDVIIKDISSISKLFYVVLRIYIPLKYIKTSLQFDRIVEICFLAVIVREVSNIIITMVKHFLEETMHETATGKKDTTRINLFHLITKIIVYVIAGLFLLSNTGVEITPLIASLGVVGIAVAFALQKILGDVFASFSIFLDKPFQIGDFIVVGTDSGHVKDIGLKSTRIHTLQGQELIIPNAELTSVRVNNYGKMKKRRVSFSLEIVYQTDPAVVERVPSLIQSIIEKTEHTEFDRVHLVALEKSALRFETVYYVTSNDFTVYRDVHQSIILNIFTTFKKEHILFAYPTQSINIQNQN